MGRIPKEGYASFARETNLKAIRIGVVREFMDKSLFTQADHESIDIIDRAIADLRQFGATIVDPGAGGGLFQKCIDQHIPRNPNVLFTRQFPLQFRAEADHISVLEDMYIDPSLVPAKLTIRDFGKTGDATIRDLTDLVNKSRYYNDTFGRDTRFRDVKATLQDANKALTLDLHERDASRPFGIQQTVMQCITMLNLDAVT